MPPAAHNRMATGIVGLDEHLGGGLVPGTLTILVGATGIGKTQFVLQFAHAGLHQEGSRGIIFDMSHRGDDQGHADYARRMFDWRLAAADPTSAAELAGFFNPDRTHGDYLHVFEYRGRRLGQRDADFDEWHQWQAELVRKLAASIAFFYGNFTGGVRRAVIDGVDPVDRPRESIQLELFEYVYHQILRKDPEWVARDLFRQAFRANAAEVGANCYDLAQIACLLSYTSRETMLDDLIARRLDEGDWMANANTVICLGKIREGNQLRRALYIAKHRGSDCTDQIIPFTIDDAGLRLD